MKNHIQTKAKKFIILLVITLLFLTQIIFHVSAKSGCFHLNDNACSYSSGSLGDIQRPRPHPSDKNNIFSSFPVLQPLQNLQHEQANCLCGEHSLTTCIKNKPFQFNEYLRPSLTNHNENISLQIIDAFPSLLFSKKYGDRLKNRNQRDSNVFPFITSIRLLC